MGLKKYLIAIYDYFFSGQSCVLCYSSHRTNCFSSPDSNSCHQNNREFYVYILFFSTVCFSSELQMSQISLYSWAKNWSLSLSVSFCGCGGRYLCLPSGTVLQPCGAVHLLFWHPGSYFPWLRQNSVPVECNFFWLFFLFLLYVSFFTIYSKKNIWIPDFSYALSQKYLSCGLKYKTESGPLTGMVQTSSSNATVSHIDGLPVQKGEFI